MQAQLSIPTTMGPARGPIPMTCGSCLCHVHNKLSDKGVSWPPVLDCGMTLNLDYGGWELPSTPLDNL